MDPKDKDLDLSPEEQKAEEEILENAEVKDDDLRAQLAEDLGIDPESEDHKEMLDKVVEREKENRKRLSGAIKQKIGWRKRAESKIDPAKKPEDDEDPKGGAADPAKVAEDKIREEFEKRDLKDLALPEAIESEVKDLAKLKGISVREAAALPYIVKLKEDHAREEKLDGSSPKRSNKGSYSTNADLSKPLDPEDYDFDTPEGVDKWNKDRKARDDYLTKNK